LRQQYIRQFYAKSGFQRVYSITRREKS
jgi:hypothetical protein